MDGWKVSTIVLSIVVIGLAVYSITSTKTFLSLKSKAQSSEENVDDFTDFIENFSIYLNSEKKYYGRREKVPQAVCSIDYDKKVPEHIQKLGMYNEEGYEKALWWARNKLKCLGKNRPMDYYKLHFKNGSHPKILDVFGVKAIASEMDCEDGPFPEDLQISDMIWPLDCGNTVAHADGMYSSETLKNCKHGRTPFYWCGLRYDPEDGEPTKHDCGHLDICATLPDVFTYPYLQYSSSLAFAGFAQGNLRMEGGPSAKVKTLYRRFLPKDFVHVSNDTSLKDPNLIGYKGDASLSKDSKEMIQSFNSVKKPDGCFPISNFEVLFAQTYCAYKFKRCDPEHGGACGLFNWTPSHPGGAWKIPKNQETLYKNFIVQGSHADGKKITKANGDE